MWMNEACVIARTPVPTKAVRLWESYKFFCDENGLRAFGRNRFYENLERIEGVRKEFADNNKRVFSGVSLLHTDEENEKKPLDNTQLL